MIKQLLIMLTTLLLDEVGRFQNIVSVPFVMRVEVLNCLENCRGFPLFKNFHFVSCNSRSNASIMKVVEILKLAA